MWVVLFASVLGLLCPITTAQQNRNAGGRKSSQDLKALIRTTLHPIVNYVNSIEPPSQMEIDLILEDLYEGITPRKVIYLTVRMTHYSLHQVYTKLYPYYNAYSIRIIKSLREFFDSHAEQTVYNPWTHLREFKQGSSQNLEPIIVSVSLAIMVFLVNKKRLGWALLFLAYFLYVYAFKSITTLFYLYVTIFSPALALVAILRDLTWIVAGSLLATYFAYTVIRRLVGNRNNKSVRPKRPHDPFDHSDVILARLNDLELRFNKMCERLARLEKEQRKK